MTVLADTWRTLSRHLELSQAMPELFEPLRHKLSLTMLLVRRLDTPAGCIETIAAASMSPHHELRTRQETPAAALQQLAQWCHRATLAHGRTNLTKVGLLELLPEGLPEGDTALVPLCSQDGPADEPRLGALIAVAKKGCRFSAAQLTLLGELAEPFSVALANDCQVRELKTLREAAEAENRTLLTRLGRGMVGDTIIGANAGLASVMERVTLVAGADAPVLILGETGTGKEVVARAIHSRSRRSHCPLIRVNCGAIPSELVDSELFGHEKGSFTGAAATRKGWFERADGGTLFLDEIGELPLAAQVRLLRVLQDGSFERVGGQSVLHANVRLVAATHCDLHEMVGKRLFREDLWYRISVFPIHLPPLRERVEDIAALATHLALKSATRLGLAPALPTQADLSLLASYEWPGNVRELASVIERAAILGNGRGLEVAKALGIGLPRSAPRPALSGSTLPANTGKAATETALTLDLVTSQHIEATLAACRGRIEGPFGAAKALGINPHTLRARMRKLGIDWARYRSDY